MSTSVEVSNARDLFFEGDVDGALEKLNEVLEGVVISSEEALFDAQCVRLSIKCMLGQSSQVLPSMPIKSQHDQIMKWYLEGMSSLQEGRSTRMAGLKFDQIIKNNPHFLGAYVGLGAAAYRSHDYAKSFQHFSKVLEIGGADAPNIVRVGMAMCSIGMKQYSHAKKCLTRALQLEPSFVLAHMAMIVVQLFLRDLKGAISSVRKLHKLIPDNSLAIQKFADYLYIQAVKERSLSEELSNIIKQLIETSSNDPSITSGLAQADRKAYASFQLGRLLHQEGRLEEAEACYIASIKVLSKFVAPKLYLAKLFLTTSRRQEARNVLTSLDTPLSADRDVILMLASSSEAAGNSVRAMWYAQRLALDYATEDPMAWWLLSYVYRKERSQARYYIKKAIVANGGSTHKDWRAQASQLALENDIEGLKEILSERSASSDKELLDAQLITKCLDSHPQLLPVAFNLATLLASRTRDVDATAHATAQRLLIAIVKRFPHMKESYYLLADIALAHKQFAQAQKWLALCLSVFPKDGMSLTMLSKLCVDNDAPKVAEELLKRADATCPTSTLARGALYLKSAQVPSEKAPELLMAAKDCFTSVLRRDPANILAAHGVACCISAAGGNLSKRIRMAAAEQCLYQVGSITANDPRVSAGSKANQVNHLVRTRATTSSISILKKDEDTLSIPQRVALAFCYATQRNFEEAIAAIDKAIAAKPADQGLQYNRLVLLFGSIVHDLGNFRISTEAADDIRTRLEAASGLAMSFVTRNAAEGDGILVPTLQSAQVNIRRIARELHGMDEALVKAANRHQVSKEEMVREKDLWKRRAATLKEDAEETQRDLQLRNEVEERRRREVHEEWARQNSEFLNAPRETADLGDGYIPVFGENDGEEAGVDGNAELLGALGLEDAETQEEEPVLSGI